MAGLLSIETPNALLRFSLSWLSNTSREGLDTPGVEGVKQQSVFVLVDGVPRRCVRRSGCGFEGIRGGSRRAGSRAL